jgi:hypothetical protein
MLFSAPGKSFSSTQFLALEKEKFTEARPGLHAGRANRDLADYFQGGAAPQRSHEVVALVGSRLVGPNLPRG